MIHKNVLNTPAHDILAVVVSSLDRAESVRSSVLRAESSVVGISRFFCRDTNELYPSGLRKERGSSAKGGVRRASDVVEVIGPRGREILVMGPLGRDEDVSVLSHSGG